MDHLINIIRKVGYAVKVYDMGLLDYGVTLSWNYKQRYVDICMSGYVAKIVARFKQERRKK